MASRTKQKEEARARRLAEEQSRLARERQQRRLRMIGGVVLVAIVVVAVAIAVSSGGGSSSGLQSGTKANKSASEINGLLTGIPQSGNVLGSPSAKVTVTEFGDLECPVCRDFAEGAERNLIANDIRSGKAKLVYRSLSTATGNGPNPGIFPTQQAAALAAGLQNKAWNYILLFYREQGAEDTGYVNDSYLTGLAKQVTGLNLSKWQTDRNSPNLVAQVNQDQQVANGKGYNSTPTIVVSGPKGQAQPIVGDTDYGSLEKAIKSVS
jgi:protein-disulfide isomerase